MVRSTGSLTPDTWRSWPHSLGMQDRKPAKTPGDKNDSDKTFRYRDLDGEGDGSVRDAAYYVDELFGTQDKLRRRASPGRVPASPSTRKVHPKLAQWADSDSDDAVPDYSKTMPVSSENVQTSEQMAGQKEAMGSSERASRMRNGYPSAALGT